MGLACTTRDAMPNPGQRCSETSTTLPDVRRKAVAAESTTLLDLELAHSQLSNSHPPPISSSGTAALQASRPSALSREATAGRRIGTSCSAAQASPRRRLSPATTQEAGMATEVGGWHWH